MFMPTLDCKRVIFYSPADEAAFFRFAEGIDGIVSVRGSADATVLDLASKPSDQALRDLIALFERYRISDVAQLAQFLSDSNKSWFADPQTFWYKNIFGDATRHI
jgi:hypothetical protein